MKAKLLIPLFVLVTISVVFTIAINRQDPKVEPFSTEVGIPETNLDVLTITDEAGRTFEIAIKDIPIFKAYLDAQDDAEIELERTQYEMINSSSEGYVLILKYGCGNKQCSTLLIKARDSEVFSVPLSTGIFQDFKISPGQDELLVRYGYNEGGVVVRHILIAIDLQKMKVIPFESTELAEEYMYTPTWPIVDYQWMDDEKFSIETSDLTSSDFDTVKDWYASGDLKTKRVEILLSKTERLDAYEVIEE
ncbi:hypothetical protein MHZ92_03465 [Sporosarcina sp. ACRSL]|uniref:hypothetical protein n=1 Tax=Sporosarcina sp. ACRSL TaxID=2918215 RepID=UPI001EF73552|nr:hypothetical protein [Sporosarcina sp. ACRSL]MCG7343177.1 hypothetical protein [Sporosarcina sp. ACRSL]